MNGLLGHAARNILFALLMGLSIMAVGVAGAVDQAEAQSFGDFMKKALTQNAQPQPTPPQEAADDTPQTEEAPVPPPSRSWLGYSLQFEAVRPLLRNGDFAAAKTAYETGKDASGSSIALPVQQASAQPSQTAAVSNLFSSLAAASRGAGTNTAPSSTGVMRPLFSTAAPFLSNVELGTLFLDAGDFSAARGAFDVAGQSGGTSASQATQGGERSVGARAAGALRSLGRGAASLAGNAELGAYNAPDFERVLQLNFLSLSYLLLGDDKAFNVSRRASERQRDAFESLNDRAAAMQDEARAAFEAEQAQARAKLAAARENPDQKQGADAVDSQLSAAYQTEDFCVAPNLPSAYVNPMSFYLNGIVYEISSAQFPEDRDTARISYEKAFQLAPEARVIEGAVRDLNSQRPRTGRLAHILVAEGFAPTRQAIRMQLTYNAVVAPIVIPRLTCHPSSVASIEVRTLDGRTAARLDQIANFEGMMLQRQKDRESITALAVFANTLRSALENQAAQQNAVLGLLAQVKQESFDRPDMRSWSTLPARMHAARVYLPNDVAEVDIVSLNAQHQVISSSRARIDTQSRQNVIYARATEAALAVAPAAQLWIRGL